MSLSQHTESTADSRHKLMIVNEPATGWDALNLGELWDYRELLFYFTWRSIKVRYKQTVLGAAWAIIQPFFTMVVFSLFFGNLAQIPSDGVPYPIFSYTALVPWTFFASGMGTAARSLVSGSNMIKKVYFPRMVMPISAVASSLIDFLLAFVVLLLMIAYYSLVPQGSAPVWIDMLPVGMQWQPSGMMISWNVVWLPFFLLIAFVTALGISLWLSAMNVQFRDVSYLIPFLTQILLFITPVVYPSSLLSEPWRTIYGINPMVGVIEGFRWALLGTSTPPGMMVFISFGAAVLLLVSGAFYFRRMEKSFADVV